MKKYYTLYQELKQKIRQGEYLPDTKLPSKRVLADMTGYSLITVEKAYAMLEDEGYLYTRLRSGYYVAPVDLPFDKTQGVEPKRIQYLSVPTDIAQTDLEYSVWFKTVRKVLSEQRNQIFVKSPNKGCSILRNAIAEYLLRYRGMFAQPEQIVIGSGAEQLYESVIKLLGRDKVFGVENPCYSQITAAYSGMGTRLCPLEMGIDGIVEAELQKPFDVLHITPFNSYPSGVTTSIVKRYRYLRWAEETGNYIVEDDYDSEFFLPGHPIESLYALDTKESVIYINTFSKSLSPAIRIGYMILPEKLIPVYDRVLGEQSCSVPVMDQYVLAEFISSGNFERHLNRMRRTLKRNPIDNR